VEVKDLEEVARRTRAYVVKMLSLAGSGHPGGSLSCVELLVALYFKAMRHKSREPQWSQRDRFVLSKGHGVPTLYAVLAQQGYFGLEHLWTLRKLGSILQGHPDRLFTPGVECSTGSLGQGFSVAVGMAMAAKIDKKNYRVYALLGDGEVQEGQIWEAAMAAAHYKLDNLCAIIDYNKFQIDGRVEDVMQIEPLSKKWYSFGWWTLEVDGHSFPQILDAYNKAMSNKGAPTVIIAHTIKGKGVSFMEGNNRFHGVAPTEEECKAALKELGYNDI
jgi:transketolase